MFGLFKKEEFKVVSPADGTLVPIDQVPDPTFSMKLMGDGFAVKPANGTICSPISGNIVTVFPTGHAVGIKNKDGVECLIHIGLDTVNLNGKGFKTLVGQGDKVKAGQALVQVDKEALENEGYNLITMVIMTGGYDKPIQIEEKSCTAGEKIL
ncbi:MAG: PTS glucose transporter subunit IIA [Allobaculum sp.]